MSRKVVSFLTKCVIIGSVFQITHQQQHNSSSTAPSGRQQFRRVCYFTNWSCDLLVKEAHFCLRHIDVNLCTHMIYAFAGINVTSLSLIPSRVDDESKGKVKGRYVLFNDLKRNNTRLKTLLSVGGSYQTEMFIQITATASTRSQFAYNTAFYVRNWGFDGLDIDWEYPQEGHKEALTLLVQDLRLAFYQEAQLTGNKELIISLAAPASDERVNAGFQVKKISQHVDMINIMAYDFYGAWGRITGFNSPLYPRVSDTRFSYKHCVEWTVNLWLRLGAPAHKINLGIATYGQSFSLDIKSREATMLNSSTAAPANTTVVSPEKTLGDERPETDPTESTTRYGPDNMVMNSVHDVIYNKGDRSDNPTPQKRNCSQNDVTCSESRPETSISNAVQLNAKQRSRRQSEQTSRFEASDRVGERAETSRGVHHRRDKAHIIDVDPSVYGVGARSSGPGKPGRLRHLDGQLSYPEICENTKFNDGHVFWDEEQQVPFVTYDDQWIGFDNVRSVVEKVKWAVRHNLGGVMLWSLDLDDFTGNYCGEGRYPLLSAISRTLLSLAIADPSFSEDSIVGSKKHFSAGDDDISQSRDDWRGSAQKGGNSSDSPEQGIPKSNSSIPRKSKSSYESSGDDYEGVQDNATTLLPSVGDIYGRTGFPQQTPTHGGSNGTRFTPRKHPKTPVPVAMGPSAMKPTTATKVLEGVDKNNSSPKNENSHHRRRSGVNNVPSHNDIPESNTLQEDHFETEINENNLNSIPDVDLFDYESGANNDAMNDYYYYIAFKAEPKVPADVTTTVRRTPAFNADGNIVSVVQTTTTIIPTTAESIPTTTSSKQTTRSVGRKRPTKDKRRLPASIRLNAATNLTVSVWISVLFSFIVATSML